MSGSGYDGGDEQSVNTYSNRSYERRKPKNPPSPHSLIANDSTLRQARVYRQPLAAMSDETDRLDEYCLCCDDCTGYVPQGWDCDGCCALPLRGGRISSQAKDKQWKLVWPRNQNPRHGRWGHWDRIKDLANGKGPDIWIEDLHGNGPHHPVWTGWKTAGNQHRADLRPRWTNLGCGFRQDLEWLSPIKAARDRDGKKYDYRTRMYRTPQPDMWSDVIWSDTEGQEPWYTRNGTGREWVNPVVDGGAFKAGWGQNPFFGNPNWPNDLWV